MANSATLKSTQEFILIEIHNFFTQLNLHTANKYGNFRGVVLLLENINYDSLIQFISVNNNSCVAYFNIPLEWDFIKFYHFM